jgi:uncharacterized membrane protein YdjX (TVP38/TMEM64 family)
VKKSVFYLVLTLLIAWLTGVLMWRFMQGEAFQTYLHWAQSNLFLYVGMLVFLKLLSVIYPPLPSSILTLSAIPILGWFGAYLVDYSGSILGSSISYWIGYQYGIPVLSKILEKSTVEKLSKVRIKKGKEIEGVIVLRVLTGATLIEAVNYGAGLLKVPYKKFLAGFLISHPLLGIPTFYVVRNVLEQQNLLATVVFIGLSIGLLYILRNRYFEQTTRK